MSDGSVFLLISVSLIDAIIDIYRVQTGIYNVGNIRRIIPVKRFPRVWTRVVKKKKKKMPTKHGFLRTAFSVCSIIVNGQTDGQRE